jgi:hypothetical protein
MSKSRSTRWLERENLVTLAMSFGFEGHHLLLSTKLLQPHKNMPVCLKVSLAGFKHNICCCVVRMAAQISRVLLYIRSTGSNTASEGSPQYKSIIGGF